MYLNLTKLALFYEYLLGPVLMEILEAFVKPHFLFLFFLSCFLKQLQKLNVNSEDVFLECLN